jgi:hypothetical protein
MKPFAHPNYDTDVEIITPVSVFSASKTQHSPNPSLRSIARLLGRQAAAHVQKYRFEGLGRLQLMMHETKIIEHV